MECDPVRVRWLVNPGSEFILWCDSTSVAMGAALSKDNRVIEDASWLRKKDIDLHINVAELTAVVRGVALTIKWGARKLKIITDSESVHGWLSALVTGDRRIKVSGDAEMLIRRRIEIIAKTLREYGIEWTVACVPSEENWADPLTRVPKVWLQTSKREEAVAAIVTSERTAERRAAEHAHDFVHRGIKTRLYFARQLAPEVTEDDAWAAVSSCEWCTSISPMPLSREKGHLSVPKVWDWVAADITHLGSEKFLSTIDCSPSRFSVWRRIATEDAWTISAHLEDLFWMFGPPGEVLFDNRLSFRSTAVRRVCDRWEVKLRFRCADYAPGNAIVER